MFERLLWWYAAHGRRLPWRRTRDPYRILVSEVMLQQTQVSRVIPFYHCWIKQFPDWKSLASAKTSSLIHAWSGLGYNRRALFLRETAKIVVAKGAPQSIEDWETLPGVGPYTARAVHVFTMRSGPIPIDTNIRRVAGRVFLGLLDPGLRHDRRIERSLKKIDAVPEYWKIPHALMDIGAMLCTPESPNCSSCPLKSRCLAAPKFLRGRTKARRVERTNERRWRNKKFPDRIYRGRILKRIRECETISIDDIGPHVDPTFQKTKDQKWIQKLVTRLERDGFVKTKHKKIFLCND